jgi:hypothetical protein
MGNVAKGAIFKKFRFSNHYTMSGYRKKNYDFNGTLFTCFGFLFQGHCFGRATMGLIDPRPFYISTQDLYFLISNNQKFEK